MSEQNGREIAFMVSSGWGHRTSQPYVQVVIEAADFMTQMPPATARELALNLLQAAEAAEGDDALIRFFKDRMEVTDMRFIATVLTDFREARSERQETGKAGITIRE